MTNTEIRDIIAKKFPNDTVHVSRPMTNLPTFTPYVVVRVGTNRFVRICVELISSHFLDEIINELPDSLSPEPKSSQYWKLFDPLTDDEQKSLESDNSGIPMPTMPCLRWYTAAEISQMGYVYVDSPVISEPDGNVYCAKTFGFDTMREFHEFMDGVPLKKLRALYMDIERRYIARIFINPEPKVDYSTFEQGVEKIQDSVLDAMSKL